jgi:hypothetical protein
MTLSFRFGVNRSSSDLPADAETVGPAAGSCHDSDTGLCDPALMAGRGRWVVAVALVVVASTANSTWAAASVRKEPGWTARVPAVTAPQAPPEARAAALGMTGSFSIAPVATPSDATRSTPRARNYKGSSVVDVAYYDGCSSGDGSLAFARSETYRMGGGGSIHAPTEHEGIQERSPFNLVLSTDYAREGAVGMFSALLLTDPRDGRSVVFDYWDISARGSTITGTLTDAWVQHGVAVNQIRTTAPLVPCQPGGPSLSDENPIAEGARISGTVTEERVRVTITGQTLHQPVKFRATFDLRRSK